MAVVFLYASLLMCCRLSLSIWWVVIVPNSTQFSRVHPIKHPGMSNLRGDEREMPKSSLRSNGTLKISQISSTTIARVSAFLSSQELRDHIAHYLQLATGMKLDRCPDNCTFREELHKKLGDSVREKFPTTTAITLRPCAAVLLRVLELVHEALVNGVVTTKRYLEQVTSDAAQSYILRLRLLKVISLIGRDIYYKDPALFLKQAVVDRYVDDVAYMFGVRRAQLNVVCDILRFLVFW